MKYIKGLDALRAIAVLLVIHQHWGVSGFNSSAVATFIIQKILPTGMFGVDFFFVLSGFLITRILINSKKTLSKSKQNIIGNFIARRTLRIFPIYFICLLVLYVLNYPDIRHYIGYFATYTSNFLMFDLSAWTAFAHIWSLAVEEQFYLIWPFIIIFVPDALLLPIMISFAVVGTISAALFERYYGSFSDVLPFNCFHAFAIGGLYAYALLNKQIGPTIKKAFFYLLPVALILYILAKAEINIYSVRIVDSIISVNILIYVVEEKYGKTVSAIVNNKLLNSLGKMSYGIYLYHYMMPTLYYNLLLFFEDKFNFIKRVHVILIHPYTANILQLLLVIVISWLSFHLIEIRILNLKKRFQYSDLKISAFV